MIFRKLITFKTISDKSFFILLIYMKFPSDNNFVCHVSTANIKLNERKKVCVEQIYKSFILQIKFFQFYLLES